MANDSMSTNIHGNADRLEVQATIPVPETTTIPQDHMLPAATGSHSSPEAWMRDRQRISEFFKDPVAYLSEFWHHYRATFVALGYVILAFIAVQFVFTIIGFITSIPLMSPLFELVGIGYTGWFVYRYLLTASDRQQLYQKINAIKKDILGKSDLKEMANQAGFNGKGMASQGAMKKLDPLSVKKTITVKRSPDELYHYWRNFENLPSFMNHLETISVKDDKHSHWVAKAPLGMKVEWDAEIIDETENRSIVWRSMEGADVDSVGSVTFNDANGSGTEVKVVMQYNPPGGAVGAIAAAIFGENPEQQLDEDLQRFKQVMEHTTEPMMVTKS
ncbi:MAG: SRPBCC family protein [Oculatellaceae cyanobacterium Prado106]|jgi:uncharacterized membrane protein|nr:SRPBCC family protein [Oculatellaceae cyanobacterium Prado106]